MNPSSSTVTKDRSVPYWSSVEGSAGSRPSLDLAESGFKVYLLEKNLSIGGTMAQLDKTFPTNDCSMCIMSPKLVDAGRHRNIEILTNAKVETVEGGPGHFNVRVHQKGPIGDARRLQSLRRLREGLPREDPQRL